MNGSDVVVVGAGVVGLSAALVLAEKGYRVKLLASNFPSDPLSSKYTSPWAGAHFRPFPSKTQKDYEESQLTRVTQRFFKKLSVEEPESSVRFIEGIDYLEDQGIYSVHARGYTEEIDQLEEIPRAELPGGVAFGARYQTWVLNSPAYLQYLARRLEFRLGVEFVRAELVSLKQAAQLFPGSLLVNATGRGLQWTGGYDPEGFLIRGQTLLVRAPQGTPYEHKTVTHQDKTGKWTFVIRRPLDGGFILGGTKQIGDLDSTPRDEDTAELIKRGKRLYPELFLDGKLDVKKVNVGFRPARKGGIRLESEKVGDGRSIVHAYGCGGMGYELSYGIADKVGKIVDSILQKSKL